MTINFVSRLKFFWRNLVNFIIHSRNSKFLLLLHTTFVFIVFHVDIRIRVHLSVPSILYVVVDLLVYEYQNEKL
jgi:hypothetical protein